jgi:hypothetical protein
MRKQDLLRYAVIAGNILFVLWILYNGISEGFRGTRHEVLSYIGLIVLLVLNSLFLIGRQIGTEVARPAQRTREAHRDLPEAKTHEQESTLRTPKE